MNGLSLFSSAGIAETYFSENGIDIKVASELLPERALSGNSSDATFISIPFSEKYVSAMPALENNDNPFILLCVYIFFIF